jgi:hypothetical protein
MHHTKNLKTLLLSGAMILFVAASLVIVTPASTTFAGKKPGGNGSDTSSSTGSGSGQGVVLDNPTSQKYYCGGTKDRIYTSINLGCAGKGNATVDLAFAIIRFLSAGVGLVVIASIVYGGIQYTMSRGDPQATAAAVDRIRNSLLALLLFIFAYAIIAYIIPKGFLK